MARKPKAYRKMARAGLTQFPKRSLWQGADHLLWVENGIVHDQYKRFYFKDIEALILRENNRRLSWAIGWGACLALFGIICLLSRRPSHGSGFMAVLSAVALGVNWWKGPGCAVYLQTAVQVQRLTNLVRVPKALKVMDRIRAAADTAQGVLVETDLASIGSSKRIEPDGLGAVKTGEARSAAEVEAYNPLLHRILFGLLFFFGLLRGVQLWARSIPLAAVDLYAIACTFVLAIVVLARWHGNVKGTVLSLASWLTLVFAILQGLSAYVMFIIASMRHPDLAFRQWAIFRAFLGLRVGDGPMVWGIAVAAAVISVGLGLLGWMATLGRKSGPLVGTPRNSAGADGPVREGEAISL